MSARFAQYQCEWVLSELDLKLRALAERYVSECEAYDRTVCTGAVVHGWVMPATIRELALINRNARAVFKQVSEEARNAGGQPEELRREIAQVARQPPQSL